MDWREAKKRLLQDKDRREAYEKTDLEYEIGKMITDARIFKKLTQEKLAKLVGTRQPSIARLERGDTLPSLTFLRKIAEALGTQLLPTRFEFLDEHNRKETKNLMLFVHFAMPADLKPAWSTGNSNLRPRLVSNHNVLSKMGNYDYANN